MQGVEYYGDIGFLKAGLQFADRITTVSPTYAREIQGDEGGMGLGGLLRDAIGRSSPASSTVSTRLSGIPRRIRSIASRYDVDDLDRRAANKTAMQQRFGLEPRPDAFLLGVISRLSWQKGLDLLLESLPALLGEGHAACGAGER